jgi:hypothetical protein
MNALRELQAMSALQMLFLVLAILAVAGIWRAVALLYEISYRLFALNYIPKNDSY